MSSLAWLTITIIWQENFHGIRLFRAAGQIIIEKLTCAAILKTEPQCKTLQFVLYQNMLFYLLKSFNAKALKSIESFTNQLNLITL